jgi:2'-5' RNA ligase
MPGKRLFIAVDIDDATRAQVERISSRLRSKLDTGANASWVRSDRMHLTLHFIGSADAAVEQQVRAVLARPIFEAPFDVAFDGVGCFPERGSPRVLWLGVSAGVDALRRLHSALDVSALPGLPPKHPAEPFMPHLTLARFRDRMPRGVLGKFLEIPASAGPSRIDRVTLYESRLSPAGPAYIPLAEAHLRQ